MVVVLVLVIIVVVVARILTPALSLLTIKTRTGRIRQLFFIMIVPLLIPSYYHT
jgi:hypothetical protein